MVFRVGTRNKKRKEGNAYERTEKFQGFPERRGRNGNGGSDFDHRGFGGTGFDIQGADHQDREFHFLKDHKADGQGVTA